MAKTDQTQIGESIARILLRVGAVSINAEQLFVYTSGIKSPIYSDDRLLISYPAERAKIVEGFVRRIDDVIGLAGVDVIAGTATAGIPWAAWIADRIQKPMIYVRPIPKEHGKTRQIEGTLKPGQRVIVIEDLITTGVSSLQTVDSLRSANAVVSHCFAIFTYEFSEAQQSYKQHGVQLAVLTTVTTLLKIARAENLITQKDQQAVLEWLAYRRSEASNVGLF